MDVMDGDQLMDSLEAGPKDKTPALPPPPSEDGNALIDSLENPPSQAERLAREKQSLQGAEEKPGAFLARTMLPWGATAINVSRDVKYKSAKERYDKGEARYDDLEQIASYEHLRDLRSKYNTGGKLLEGAARIPGMVAETVGGGALLEPLTALQAAPAISATGGISGRALAQQAGLGLVKNAATTAATPSMYLGQASERSVENGGTLLAPKNIVPAYLEGVITNAILGKAKAGGIGLPTIAGRTVTGMAEQQVADVITSAVDDLHDSKEWKFNTGYGLVGELAKKDGHPLQHAATQALTFAIFSTMHGGDHKPAEAFGEAAKSLHEAGYSEADAAKVLANTTSPPPLPKPVAEKVNAYAQAQAEMIDLQRRFHEGERPRSAPSSAIAQQNEQPTAQNQPPAPESVQNAPSGPIPPAPPVAPGPAEVTPAAQPDNLAGLKEQLFKATGGKGKLKDAPEAIQAAFDKIARESASKSAVPDPQKPASYLTEPQATEPTPETKPPETPPIERRQPDGVGDVTLGPARGGMHFSGEKINTHKLLDAAGKEIGEAKIIPRGENLHVEWIGIRGAATGEAAAIGKIGRAGVRSLLGQIAEQYPDAATVSGLRGERRAKISIPREAEAKPPEAPPKPAEEVSRDLFGNAIPKTFGRIPGAQQSAFQGNTEISGSSGAWMDRARDFAAEKGQKVEGFHVGNRVNIGGDYYQGRMEPNGEWKFEKEPSLKENDRLAEIERMRKDPMAPADVTREGDVVPEELNRRIDESSLNPQSKALLKRLLRAGPQDSFRVIGQETGVSHEWVRQQAKRAVRAIDPEADSVESWLANERQAAVERAKEHGAGRKGESPADAKQRQAELANTLDEAEQLHKEIADAEHATDAAAERAGIEPASLRRDLERRVREEAALPETHDPGQGTPPGPSAPPAGPAQAAGGLAPGQVDPAAFARGRPARRDIVAEGWHVPLMTPQQSAQRERMRQINADKGQSLLSVVRKLGIDKTSATTAGWNTDLIEEDFPRLFKRGGKSLAELAEHLGNEGHTEPIPEEHQTNPGDWLLAKLQAGVKSLHSDLENRYDKESARAAQDAREAAGAGISAKTIAETRAAFEAAGEAEGRGLEVEEITRELRNEGDAAEPAGPGADDFGFGANEPVIDADWKFKLPGGGEPGQPGVAQRPGPETANPYAPSAARDTRPQKLTALANAKVDAERRANSLPEIMKPARQANPESWDKAMDRLEADPQAGVKLVDELAKKTRATTVEENALLLHEKITRSNDLSRKTRTYLDATADVIDGKPGAASLGDLEILDAQVEAARERVSQIDQVTKSTGTEWGRAGQFRRQLAAEDFSLAGMMEAARAAKGKKLTPEEEIQIGKMQERIINLEGKLADAEGRLEAEGKGALSKSFGDWTKTRAASEDAKADFRRKIGEFRDEARPWTRKLEDILTRWRRFGVLSGVKTLGKIGTAGLEQIAFNPIYEAVGSGLRRIPGLDKIAALAPREGSGFRGKIEAKAFMSAFSEGFLDAYQTFTKGRSQLDVLYGKGEGEFETKGWLDWPGIVHAAIKSPARRGEYTRSLLHRLDAEAKAGRDPTTPASLMRAGYEAYKDANRSVFREDNRVAEAVQKFIAPNATDSAGMRGIRLAGRLALPVTKVPTNLVAQAVESTVGMVTGSVRAGLALRRGVETLKPQEADLIMRQLKRGSIGAALFALGALAPNLAGGFHQPGKRKDELEPMDVATPAGKVPGTFLHHPAFYSLQAGATFRRVIDSSRQKHGAEVATENAVLATVSGLVEETPFGRETLEIGRDMEAKEKGYKFGEFVKSASAPQLFQWLAGEQDKPHPFSQSEKPTPRKPEGVGEHIETGIPWARQRVKVGKR